MGESPHDTRFVEHLARQITACAACAASNLKIQLPGEVELLDIPSLSSTESTCKVESPI